MPKKTIGYKDDYIYEIPLEEIYYFDINNPIPFYEYYENLDELENIKRKMILKEYGRELTHLKEYDKSIDYHKSLMKNSYFNHDWYP